MKVDPNEIDELTLKINRETAKISWLELQKFFAQGRALRVADGQDLIQVAKWMAEDNAVKIKPLLESAALAPVEDQLASTWLESEQEVWAVVSAPWVIVQAVK